MVYFYVFGFLMLMVFCISTSKGNLCDRRPLGYKTDPLPPDSQFVLDIDDIRNNEYIPRRNYTVRLHARDEGSTFIGFTISLKEDSTYNIANPRRPILLLPGTLVPKSDQTLAVPHEYCNNTVIQSDITAKTSVEATWFAPDKGNKCVSIFAVVAVRPNVWYNFEGPLSRKVCEDPRNDEDMPPTEVDSCNVCEDARYELTFQGLWSYNTHLDQFYSPTHESTAGHAHFSDIVGASHDSQTFTLYKIGAVASDGLKMLAEQGNTTELEIAIKNHLGSSVRTVIKATSPPFPDMAAVAQFRTSKKYHRVSLATAIVPSPDWFLGVSNMELCSRQTKQWAEKITLNLYPLDAGTDKGTEFNSANEVTLPHQPITQTKIGGEDVKKPFARLILTLIRTYDTNEKCENDVDENATENQNPDIDTYDNENNSKRKTGGGDGGSDSDDGNSHEEPSNVPTIRTTTSEAPPSVDPQSSEGCPMTPWEEWPCEGDCVNNLVVGYKMRYRYHLVNNNVVNLAESEDQVPKNCLNEETRQTVKCEESCEQKQPEGEEEEK